MEQKDSKQKKKKKKPLSHRLTEKQRKFCREYIKTGNGKQSAIKAGYTERSAEATACTLLRYPQVIQEISRIREKQDKKAIMDAQEVMELYSAIARGEVADQFGLEASLGDRLKAMNEIAKRTVDIENRMKGVPDNNIVIKLDWHRS